MLKRIILCTSCLLFSQVILADSDAAAELQRLKAELKALSAQINRLEQQLQSDQSVQKPASKPVKASANETTEKPKLHFSGDMRGRYEYIDHRGREIRQRSRIRLRLAADANINESTSLHMRLATGGDNPTSTNLTLDGGFSRKDIGLDRAYVQYRLSDRQQLWLGKMRNPYQRIGGSGILFDSDLNPEGLAWKLSTSHWQAALGVYYLDERASEDNIMLYGGQLAFKQAFTASEIMLGFGYYDYDQLQGAEPVYQNERLGNRFNQANQLINDFNIAELYAEYSTRAWAKPLSLFAAYYNNLAADDEHIAGIIGLNYGGKKQAGDWQLGYSYQYTEADAVYALFNDSDFADGYTDARGHSYRFGYGLNRNLSFSLTWLDAVRNMHLGNATDYDRIMLDLSYDFK